MSDNIRRLAKTISQISKRHVKVQTSWATVKSVDWEKKTMVAVGVIDELEYNDVLLGIGSVYQKTLVDSHVLIGMIENQEAAFFLIEAEKVEELMIDSPKITINGGDNKGLVKIEALKDNLEELKKFVEAVNEALPTAFSAILAGTSADGSKGKATYDSAMTGRVINFKDMENTYFKH